ncbi:hypothetical protein ACQ86N_17230 [Puia sp. P3]|uniref:hypothetical protein n=1 Tax=Puia sp. P3 TaxID=3423952 RepID=UPI003D6657F1
MKRFHHQLLKGLLLFAILSLFQTPRTFAGEDKDSSIRLSEALRLVKDHYKVDILFEDRTVDGLLVPSGLINFGRSAEENISALIGPFALNYKKVKARSYLIMQDKTKKLTTIAGAAARIPHKQPPKLPPWASPPPATDTGSPVPSQPSKDSCSRAPASRSKAATAGPAPISMGGFASA